MIAVFFAQGFEELEALAPVDLLRRAGLDVKTVGVGGLTVRGSNGVPMVCDVEESSLCMQEVEAVILPGGMPGAAHLGESKVVRAALEHCAQQNHWIGAICAAPMVLGKMGLLQGKQYTCYPGFESDAFGGTYTGALCQQDGCIITAKGPGACIAFGLQLIRALVGDEKSDEIARSIQCQ